jgi:ligand-binding SRPBCC domain-containing protein
MFASTGYAYEFESETPVGARPEEAFAFLADPCGLPTLDPPWLKVQLLSVSAGLVHAGSEMEYIFRWLEIPLYLRLIVAEYEPPVRLVLSQAQGPWQSFVHTITLRPASNGAVISERMRFRVPPGPFERVLHGWLIQRQFRKVIHFRKRALADRWRAC